LAHRVARDSALDVGYWAILLQNSKVAASRIFRENKKRETIADSCALNRVAELASVFDVRGAVPSHLYINDVPTARRIFNHLCKTTFATESGKSGLCIEKSFKTQRFVMRCWPCRPVLRRYVSHEDPGFLPSWQFNRFRLFPPRNQECGGKVPCS
jgi:hypothetical protein